MHAFDDRTALKDASKPLELKIQFQEHYKSLKLLINIQVAMDLHEATPPSGQQVAERNFPAQLNESASLKPPPMTRGGRGEAST